MIGYIINSLEQIRLYCTLMHISLDDLVFLLYALDKYSYQ